MQGLACPLHVRVVLLSARAAFIDSEQANLRAFGKTKVKALLVADAKTLQIATHGQVENRNLCMSLAPR